MEKLRLSLDELVVESFAPAAMPEPFGTVHAAQQSGPHTDECASCVASCNGTCAGSCETCAISCYGTCFALACNPTSVDTCGEQYTCAGQFSCDAPACTHRDFHC
jgi:hypothetical protein